MLALKVLDKKGNTVCVSSSENYVSLVCTAEYKEGDCIVLEASEKNIHVLMQLDDGMGSSFIYLTDNISYNIPFGEKRIAYSPKAFYGNRHYLYARTAREDEVKAYRNLASNVYDQHENSCSYPHA